MSALAGTGLALILAQEWCLFKARRQHSTAWEDRGRLLQCGVIFVWSIVAGLALGNMR